MSNAEGRNINNILDTMKFLPRQLRNEHYSYTSDKPAEHVITDLEKIFNNKHLFRDLRGEFTGKNTFVLSSNFGLGFNRGPLYSFTRIRGRVIEKNNKSILEVVIKPHMITYAFFFAFILFGLFSIASIITNSQEITIEKVIVLVVFTFIIPFATAFYGQVAKDNLRDTFIKTLKLQEEVQDFLKN